MPKLSLVVFPVCHPQSISTVPPEPEFLPPFPKLSSRLTHSPPIFFTWLSIMFLSPYFHLLSSFSPVLFSVAGVTSCLVVCAHPNFPLPCQYQQTSTCLQMRKRETVREEWKAEVQQLWIIDIGREGGITRHKEVHSYISIIA